MHPAFYPRLPGGIAQGLAHRGLHGVPTAQLLGLRVMLRAIGPKDMLPFPASLGILELLPQGMRQVNLCPALLAVVHPNLMPPHQMRFQAAAQRLRQRHKTILIALAVTHRDETARQINLLDPQIENLHQPKAAPILQRKKDIPRVDTPLQKTPHGIGSNDLRKTPTTVGIALFFQHQIVSQHPADQPSQSIAGLGDARFGEVLLQSERPQKSLRHLRSGFIIRGKFWTAPHQPPPPFQIRFQSARAVLLGL